MAVLFFLLQVSEKRKMETTSSPSSVAEPLLLARPRKAIIVQSPSEDTRERETDVREIAFYIAEKVSSDPTKATVSQSDLNTFFGRCSRTYEDGVKEATALVERLVEGKDTERLPFNVFYCYLLRKLKKLPTDMHRNTLKSLATDIQRTRDAAGVLEPEPSSPQGSQKETLPTPASRGGEAVKKAKRHRKRGEGGKNRRSKKERSASKRRTPTDENQPNGNDAEKENVSRQRRSDKIAEFKSELKKTIDNTQAMSSPLGRGAVLAPKHTNSDSAGVDEQKSDEDNIPASVFAAASELTTKEADDVPPAPVPAGEANKSVASSEKGQRMLRSRHVKKMKSVKAKFAKEYHGKSMAMEKKFTDEISKLKKVVEDSEKFCGKIGSTLAHERDEAQRTIAALKVKHERSEARCQEIQQSAKAYKDQAEGLQRKLEKLQNDRDPGKWKLKYEKSQRDVETLRKAVKAKDEQMQENLRHHQSMIKATCRAAKVKYEHDLRKAVCMKTGIASPVVVQQRSMTPKFIRKHSSSSDLNSRR